MNNFWFLYEKVLRTELAGKDNLKQLMKVRVRNAKYVLNSNAANRIMTDEIANLLLMRFAEVACLCTSKLCQLELCNYTELVLAARERRISADACLGWN